MMDFKIYNCILIGLLCVFSVSVPSIGSAPTDSNAKIVIVGAGASGIAAAVKLLDYGFKDVTILEAESRIGGRILTIPFADNVIDLGAQWCHGETNNVVYETVKDRNMLGSSKNISENVEKIRSKNGEIVPEDVIKPLSEIFEEIERKREMDNIPKHVSAHDFMKEELDKALEKPEYMHIDKKIAYEYLRNQESGESALEASDDLTIMPAHAGEGYEECEGDNLLTWKDKGYRSFLNVLMRTEESGKEYGVLQDHIRLSKKVKNINWKRNDGKVMITCKDGEEILADHVLVTVSLGVLKENLETMFEPHLPDKKLTAIREINFGAVGKVFLEFDKKFWPNSWTGFLAFWSEEDLESMKSTDKFWWAHVPVFTTVDYQPRILEVWFNGPAARHMETMTDKDVKDGLLEMLDKFIKFDISEVVNMTRSSWYTNPNFRGTYSHHSIKTLEAGATTRDLEEPLTVPLKNCLKANEISENHCEKPVLQFAGEATNFIHYATVHGAVESGWREAKRLSEFYT